MSVKIWDPPPGAREWLKALLLDWLATQTPEATAQQGPCPFCGSTFASGSLLGRLEHAAELTDEEATAVMQTFRVYPSAEPAAPAAAPAPAEEPPILGSDLQGIRFPKDKP